LPPVAAWIGTQKEHKRNIHKSHAHTHTHTYIHTHTHINTHTYSHNRHGTKTDEQCSVIDVLDVRARVQWMG
jgi:hypothetical protein